MEILFKKRKFLYIVCACALVVFSPYPIKSAAAFDGEILRFHVIANSNSPEDQALKLKVRDHVLDVFKTLEFDNAKDAERVAIAHSSLLREAALDVVDFYGKNYNVTVTCGIFPFPQKSYGNITLPKGNYNAVRVVIGEGKGENWWCVMYPPLCFIDEAAEFDKSSLSSLSEDTVKKITGKPEIKVKFKFAEIAKKLI